MPTVLLINQYRFYFYSRETGEPPHIHVEWGDKLAKYWLEPLELASFKRFRPHGLTSLREMVEERQDEFLRAWHEYFDAEH